ncbi:MAG: 4Fe-4S dicluster domain-containing protein [Gammaproteobacteria bacterium]
MKQRFPSPTYHFKYRVSPVSGNWINGFGVIDKVRPVQIFHGSGRRQLEWQALEDFFLITMPFRLFFKGLLSRWRLRKADGPISKKRREVTDPVAMADEIKQVARQLGAGAAGITSVTEEALYRNYETPFRYAVSIASPMDFDEMEYVTELRGGMETMRTYMEITGIVVRLARYIRHLGWPARAYCESADILHIPLAIKAGMGELGKHGSLINKKFGSNIRLATILTDLPMAVDKPVDIGVEDLCLSCRRCTIDCPADAISDSRHLVRGIKKWYVNFDKCVPYFVKTFGCGICIQVCPWSQPGQGPALSEKLLNRRKSE